MNFSAPAWLKLIFNFFKTFWWIIVLVFAAIIFVLGGFYIFRKKESVNDDEEVGESFVKNVADKVSDSITDIKVEKAIVSTRTEMLRNELEKVREEKDGKERRKKLASILQKSI